VKKFIEIVRNIDLRDVLLVAGLLLLWWGLFLFLPWVSYSVCGSLLLIAGYFMPQGRGD